MSAAKRGERPDLYAFDRALLEAGESPLCGVDEAGRGPLAGPVCAAAVILPPGEELPGINDSKKLSEKRREQLYEQITQRALAWSVAFASAQEIDRVNILQATFLAMRRAVEGLQTTPAMVLVDGNRDPGLGLPTRTVVGGDGKSAAIAAASILAKVTRDRYLLQLDRQYPQYAFAKHKGYGTQLHYQLLGQYGPCPEHRRSFLRKWMEGQQDG